jgi:hypothetical protein
MTEETTTKPDTIKSHCNNCLASTNHEILHTKKKVFEEAEGEQISFWEIMLYQLVECRGCENISLRRTYRCAGMPTEDVDYFPPAISRQMPKWLKSLSMLWNHANIVNLTKEIYSSIHAGNNRVAMMGARSLIDMTMNDKLGDSGNFTSKLSKMEAKGFISKQHHELLEAALEAGHAATHRDHKPSIAEINHVMDIVESLIQSIYVLDKSASALNEKTPKRSNPNKKNND